jgi:hypothetical protein
MSFASWALRTATVHALRGRTIAEDRIGDSETRTIGELAKDEAHPFATVYSGATVETPSGNDLHAPFAMHTLILEIGIAAHQRAKKGDGTWGIPPTDAGLSFTVDALGKQIRGALVTPGNAWGDLWLRMVTRVHKITTETGGGDKAFRFAARQITIECTVLREPVPGVPLGPVWSRFFDLAAADPDLAPQIGLMRDVATGGSTTWPPYAALRAGLGLPHSTMGILYPLTPREDP